jgi:hypothetical protein
MSESDGRRATHRSFVSYIDKSREYYAAQGYENPYAWLHHEEVPFAALPGPLAELRLGVVTTAAWPGGTRDEAYTRPVDPPPAVMDTSRLFWDRGATHTDDVETFLPLRRLRELERAGRIGSLSDRFYAVPTLYSQRRTTTTDAPKIAAWCREDGVQAVLAVPL